MTWLRRAWRDYLEHVDPPTLHEISRPAVLVTVFVVCSAPWLVMGYVPAVQRATGYRASLLTEALLAIGLGSSYLLHRATGEPRAPRARIALLNLLDTGFLATWLVSMAASADHPTDCVLALLLVAVAIIWGLGAAFSWPMLVPAALWPATLMAFVSGGHVLRPLIAALNVPGYVIIAMLTRAQARQKREAADAARAKLAESSRLATLGQVGASLAHEMNQPLGAIRGLAERLRTGEARGSGDELEAIARASSHLSRLVEQVGLLGAPQAARPEPLDLATPVEDALLLMRAQLEHRGIEVEWFRPDEALPRVLADRQRLGQVVVNLLSNARDALAELPPDAARSIRIELAGADGRVSLAVTDSGPGVPPEVEPRVFDPFFTTKERGRGGGLGLAISREIAQEHGGTLALERPAGGGARFRMELPAIASKG